MGKIQSKTGEIPTLDDALQELIQNYKKKKSNYELRIFRNKKKDYLTPY